MSKVCSKCEANLPLTDFWKGASACKTCLTGRKVRAYNVPEGNTKVCKACGIEKPIDEFYMARRNMRETSCKDCRKRAMRDSYKSQPEVRVRKAQQGQAMTPDQKRNKHTRHAYRLTIEEYEALLERGCDICGSHRHLRIDHDHSCCRGRSTCGKCIRGVLCHRHNVGLGQFSDDVHELQLAIEYLRTSVTQNSARALFEFLSQPL